MYSVVYRGRETTIPEVARLAGCAPQVVYRYFHRYGNLDGFDRRREDRLMKIEYSGERLVVKEIASRLNTTPQHVRDFYRRHKTLDGFRIGHKGLPLEHLARFYHTLDESIPLDRCIAAAGYRSIRQFCKDNDLSESLVGRWRKGKLYRYGGRLDYLPPQSRRPTLLDEMTNFRRGISTPLHRIMVGTGCFEWELFPDVFTEDYYRELYGGLSWLPLDYDRSSIPIEHIELQRALRSVLQMLPPRLRIVVELTFAVGPTRESLTYEAIGQRLGRTREGVRQMLFKAMRLLMSPSNLNVLAEVSPFSRRMSGAWTVGDAIHILNEMKSAKTTSRDC